MESGGSGVVDFGRFMTGFLVVMGIGMASLPQTTTYTYFQPKATVY
jgi:hypothetical protein